jgi:molybdopterin converting factor small subunit
MNRWPAFSISPISWTSSAARRQDFVLPDGAQEVRGLLAQLRSRGVAWEKALADDKVQVLVNKKFSTPETKISDADVIAIVSNSPD